MHTFELADIDITKEDNVVSSIFQQIEDTQKIQLEISYLSAFQSAKSIREIIDYIFKQLRIDPKWVTRMVLIIDELNNNAIEYGSEKNDTNTIGIVCDITEEHVDIEIYVTDTGKWPEHKTAELMENLREQHKNKDFKKHTSIRGRGLFLIIERLVDVLYFKDASHGWLTVGFQKKLEKSTK